MARIGLCGPTYQARSLNANAQRAINLYPEHDESGSGKSEWQLYGTPGTKTFATLPGARVNQLLAFNNRLFGISNTTFAEILASGALINSTPVPGDLKPASMATNRNQILVASAGLLYVFDLTTNTLTGPLVGASIPANVGRVAYSDAYFIAFSQNTDGFQLSALLDGNTWSGLDKALVSVFPDNIVSMLVDHRELVIFGDTKAQVYYNSGNTFAYDVVPGGFAELGSVGTHIPCKLDNSVFWIHKDERGQGMAWRAEGYSPKRISTHAIEAEWAKYPSISDGVSYSFQMDGHSFWRIYFPSGLNDDGHPLGCHWQYDTATGMWSEPNYWDATNGRFTAHHSQCHAFCFGKHLVGDWSSGKIYEMSMDYLDDDGASIRRLRRTPHVSTENEKMFGASLTLDLETGIGPQPPLQGLANSTIITLADSGGGLWQVTVDDAGLLNTVSVTSGTAQTVKLNDSTLAATWRLGVTTGGLLTTTSIALDATQSTTYAMQSSQWNWNLGVTLGGNLTTTQLNYIARGPELFLRISRDGGHTWGNPRTLDCGQAGEYTKRVIARRLGPWRTATFEISMTDPVRWSILDAYLEATGYGVQERLSVQARKQA